MNKTSLNKRFFCTTFLSLVCAFSAAAQTIQMHATSERSGAQGNQLTFVAQHAGNLPSGSNVFFYVQRPNGQLVNLGRTTTVAGDLWYMNWTAEAPGTYQAFAILRNGLFESDAQIAAAAPITVTITGSALAMHASSTRVFTAGQKARAVAVTSGRLPSGINIFFYAQDTASQVLYPLGRQTNFVEQLWSCEWTPPSTSSFNVYAVMRDGLFDTSPEITRTGNLLVVPAGTPIPLPFEAVAGTYQALLGGAARPMLTVQLAASGAVTGRLVLDGLVYPFKGALGADGTATISSDLRNQPSLNLVLRSDGQSGIVSGSYQLGNGSPVEFSLLAPAYTGKGSNSSPLAKKTANVLVVPEVAAGSDLLGHGYFRATFDSKGGARVAGKMPDGRTVAGYLPALASGVTGEPVLPAYILWKGSTAATLKGELRVQENAEEPTPLLEGTLDWQVPADGKRPILPQAFQATFSAVGNLWSPSAGANALTAAAGPVNFLLQTDPEGRIPGGASNVPGTWGNDNAPVFTGLPTGAKWTFSAKTGVFAGSLPGPDGTFSFSGLIVPANGLEAGGRELRGAGFVIGKGKSAAVEITTE